MSEVSDGGYKGDLRGVEAADSRGRQTTRHTHGSANMDSKPWYWPNITREEAEKKLAGHPNGSFLIRDGKQTGDFTLTVMYHGQGRNVRVYHRNGRYGLAPEDHPFSSLEDLIQFYKTHSLASFNKRLNIYLKGAVCRPSVSEVSQYGVFKELYDLSQKILKAQTRLSVLQKQHSELDKEVAMCRLMMPALQIVRQMYYDQMVLQTNVDSSDEKGVEVKGTIRQLTDSLQGAPEFTNEAEGDMEAGEMDDLEKQCARSLSQEEEKSLAVNTRLLASRHSEIQSRFHSVKSHFDTQSVKDQDLMTEMTIVESCLHDMEERYEELTREMILMGLDREFLTKVLEPQAATSEFDRSMWLVKCDRDQAVEKLDGLPHGAFLLRHKGKKSFPFVLSIVVGSTSGGPSTVQHCYVVRPNGRGFGFNAALSVFESIDQLVLRHRYISLKHYFHDIDAPLAFPVGCQEMINRKSGAESPSTSISDNHYVNTAVLDGSVTESRGMDVNGGETVMVNGVEAVRIGEKETRAAGVEGKLSTSPATAEVFLASETGRRENGLEDRAEAGVNSEGLDISQKAQGDEAEMNDDFCDESDGIYENVDDLRTGKDEVADSKQPTDKVSAHVNGKDTTLVSMNNMSDSDDSDDSYINITDIKLDYEWVAMGTSHTTPAMNNAQLQKSNKTEMTAKGGQFDKSHTGISEEELNNPVRTNSSTASDVGRSMTIPDKQNKDASTCHSDVRKESQEADSCIDASNMYAISSDTSLPQTGVASHRTDKEGEISGDPAQRGSDVVKVRNKRGLRLDLKINSSDSADSSAAMADSESEVSTTAADTEGSEETTRHVSDLVTYFEKIAPSKELKKEEHTRAKVHTKSASKVHFKEDHTEMTSVSSVSESTHMHRDECGAKLTVRHTEPVHKENSESVDSHMADHTEFRPSAAVSTSTGENVSDGELNDEQLCHLTEASESKQVSKEVISNRCIADGVHTEMTTTDSMSKAAKELDSNSENSQEPHTDTQLPVSEPSKPACPVSRQSDFEEEVLDGTTDLKQARSEQFSAPIPKELATLEPANKDENANISCRDSMQAGIKPDHGESVTESQATDVSNTEENVGMERDTGPYDTVINTGPTAVQSVKAGEQQLGTTSAKHIHTPTALSQTDTVCDQENSVQDNISHAESAEDELTLSKKLLEEVRTRWNLPHGETTASMEDKGIQDAVVHRDFPRVASAPLLTIIEEEKTCEEEKKEAAGETCENVDALLREKSEKTVGRARTYSSPDVVEISVAVEDGARNVEIMTPVFNTFEEEEEDYIDI